MTRLTVTLSDGKKLYLSLGSSIAEELFSNKQKEAKMSKKILVVSKHRLVRKAITDILHSNQQYGFFVVGEAASKEEVIERAQYGNLDCIILDTDFGPGGDFTYLQYTSDIFPKIKMMYIGDVYQSLEENHDHAYQILFRGGKALVDKDATDGDLLYALNTLMNGGRYFFCGIPESELVEFERKSPYGEAPDDTLFAEKP